MFDKIVMYMYVIKTQAHHHLRCYQEASEPGPGALIKCQALWEYTHLRNTII